MIDIGFSELALIGVVALVVIGPEKLPDVARTAGRAFGRLQRFVAGVKADLSREFDLDELRSLKSQIEAQSLRMEAQLRHLSMPETYTQPMPPDSLPAAPFDAPEGDAHLQLSLPLPDPFEDDAPRPVAPAPVDARQLALDLGPAPAPAESLP